MSMQTISGLIEELEKHDPTLSVCIDGREPTALSSYRGFYDELAIEGTNARHERTEIDDRAEPFGLNMAGYGTYAPGHNEVRIKADPTVGDLIAALRLAVGEVFEGYNGGQFTMHPDTILWVSEYGRCEDLRIFDAIESEGSVDLITRAIEF